MASTIAFLRSGEPLRMLALISSITLPAMFAWISYENASSISLDDGNTKYMTGESFASTADGKLMIRLEHQTMYACILGGLAGVFLIVCLGVTPRLRTSSVKKREHISFGLVTALSLASGVMHSYCLAIKAQALSRIPIIIFWGYPFLRTDYKLQIVACVMTFFIGANQIAVHILTAAGILDIAGSTTLPWFPPPHAPCQAAYTLSFLAIPTHLIILPLERILPLYRFHSSRARKWWQQRKQQKHEQARTTGIALQSLRGPSAPLQSAILPGTTVPWAGTKFTYDFLYEVGKYLHYEDILSLSRTCHAFHDEIFPPDSLIQHQQRWKRITCTDTTDEDGEWPGSCWSCNNQICGDCMHPLAVHCCLGPGHSARCVPYCNICFRALTNAGYTKDAECVSSGSKTVEVTICGDCHAADKKHVMRAGKEKARYYLHRSNEGATSCSKCENALHAVGVRRWVCTEGGCEHECKSALHLAYVSHLPSGAGEV
ncbi:hypothetical protein NA57DRAFT_60932 [Rhizodiscina lignyota]|uniref:F-box domain-containing protein n=1 Tax=Rhizodiscina lignyota TaxID=1504668 RepID=A0A9P4M4H8_9PEZI|nr:hypothetical protein NA57DRAFT_60932 [Rhizodiscina lignyota]